MKCGCRCVCTQGPAKQHEAASPRPAGHAAVWQREECFVRRADDEGVGVWQVQAGRWHTDLECIGAAAGCAQVSMAEGPRAPRGLNFATPMANPVAYLANEDHGLQKRSGRRRTYPRARLPFSLVHKTPPPLFPPSRPDVDVPSPTSYPPGSFGALIATVQRAQGSHVSSEGFAQRPLVCRRLPCAQLAPFLPVQSQRFERRRGSAHAGRGVHSDCEPVQTHIDGR